MASIVYQWNPFQEIIDCNISREKIKVSATEARREFVPKAAPFFSRGVKLFREGSATPLVAGIDYVFAHPFDNFIGKYNRNVFGSVVMLKDIDSVVEMSYSTIGSPFVLDQAALATLIANIANSPRTIDWSLLVNVPSTFPTDPHDHPASQTYDYLEMMVALRSMILAMLDSKADDDVSSLLKEHLEASLVQAHKASKSDIGLDLTPNMAAAGLADLVGNSSNLLVTVAVMKTALRQLVSGSLPLGPGTDAPQPPTTLKITTSTVQGVTVYTVIVNGGAAANGKPVTYSLSQSGAVTVILSKTVGIQGNEQITFMAPAVTSETKVVISAVTVDSIGVSSDPITASISLAQSAETNEDIFYFMGQL